MRVNLLKRLESSVHSFQLTLNRIYNRISDAISFINEFEQSNKANINLHEFDFEDFDMEDQNTDYFTVWDKVQIALADMDYVRWRNALQNDLEIFETLINSIKDITPEHDAKLQKLIELISNKIENPINPNNKKVLVIFSHL